MKYVLSILSIICMTCICTEQVSAGIRFPKVHPVIRPLVAKFNKYYKKYRHSSIQNSIIVKFQKIPQSDKANGVYSRIKDVTVISSRRWYKLTKMHRETVVIHELGHHILKRSHDWSKRRMMNKECPRSMMFYQGVSDKCYKKHKKYYIRELFQWSN